MQVTQVQDHVTHAVIGANTARSFGISDSAEFFNILSNTLYSDKILAVVREVLCNAWDSHIASGRTDIPVQVTLTKEALIIRDRGTGIKKALMHSTYCVYGNSTKQLDGLQTGGFGLGCKAPFAYTDHFEVTNCNEGFKTIYRISKSSGEVGGRPGMMEILSIPTDEHGIQVKIELKDQYDRQKFADTIRRIALAGEMNIDLNGEKLETLPFSGAKEGYLITKLPIAGEGWSNHRVFVRYGNVIYPIESREAYRQNYNSATGVLDKLGPKSHGANPWRLILQAQPNTISVTPSRESLSMTDHTVETLKGLLEAFTEIRNRRHVTETQKVAEECVDQAFRDMKPFSVLNANRFMVGMHYRPGPEESVLADYGQVARGIAAQHYPSADDFWAKDVERRLKTLAKSGFGNRGKIQSYLAEYSSKTSRELRASDWFVRRLIAPLVTSMKEEQHLSADRLLVYGVNARPEVRQARKGLYDTTFWPAAKFSKDVFDQYMPFLRNLVILAHSRTDVTERAFDAPEMKLWFGSPENSLVYIVQRSDPRIAAARAFFEKHRFTVLDLTVRHKWERPIEEAPKRERAPAKPRQKGLPVLSCILAPGGHISTDRVKAENVDRTETPEFYAKIGYQLDRTAFEPWNERASRAIVRLFGSKGGIVVSETQAAKYVGQGAKHVDTWVFDRVIAELTTNTRIHDYWGVNPSRVPGGYSYSEARELIPIIANDDLLRSHYGLQHSLTADDESYLLIWGDIQRIFKWTKRTEVDAMADTLAKIPKKQSLLDLIETIKNSPLVELINEDTLKERFRQAKNDPQINAQLPKVRDLLISAIKG